MCSAHPAFPPPLSLPVAPSLHTTPACRLAVELAEARRRLAAAEAERQQLRGVLDSERGAAFASLGRFQRQQVGGSGGPRAVMQGSQGGRGCSECSLQRTRPGGRQAG